MFKKALFFLALILIVLSGCLGVKNTLPENLREVSVYTKADYTICQIIVGQSRSIKTDPDLFYYWYERNAVHMNQGGYSGNLLHGEFLRYDNSNRLIEKGYFSLGRKTSKWHTWHSNGCIASITSWRDGKPDGYWGIFDSLGRNIEFSHYKNGLLHGRQLKMGADGVAKESYCRKGKVVRKATPFKHLCHFPWRNKVSENEVEQ